MIIYILLAIIIVEFVLSFVLFEKNIISPACVFSAVFVVALLDLIRNIEYWSVGLHVNTCLIIIFGITSFIICAAIIKGMLIPISYKKKIIHTRGVNVGFDKVIISICFNTIALYAFYRSVRRIVGSRNSGGSIASIIHAYRILSVTKIDESTLPGYVNYLNIIVYAIGTLWVYVLIDNYLTKRRWNVGAIINIILVCLNYFVTGSRGKLIYFILSIVPMFYFLWCASVGRISSLPFKYIIGFLLVLILLAFSFKGMAQLTGRNVQAGMLKHISINLSAPILNLDYYAQKEWIPPRIWGYSTFNQIENSLGRNFGLRFLIHRADLAYRFVNKKALGNVATTFYPFYHDFHYVGVIVLCGLMGLISQFIFEVSKRAIFDPDGIKLSVIVYSDVFIRIAFCFFSDRFYDRFVTISFIITFFIWAVSIKFLKRIRITVG
ncbi:O-antigen polymerase [Butyrivibrio sp. JL13D10]|uniref:O-antigen polymerase n=1 Tax=Butyrivibrio sp. JL13D10 TaxID=3236815 RepID=UPI0038B5C300